MRALLLAGVVAFGFGQAARADVMFDLSNVSFTSTVGGSMVEGTLTGFFTTNDALTRVVSYDITASSAPATTGAPFAGLEYTPTDSYVPGSYLPDAYFQINTLNNLDALRLLFNAPLTTSGTTLSSANSYETEFLAGDRFLSGSIVAAQTAVPEPATLALLGLPLGLLGLVGMRRHRVEPAVRGYGALHA